MLRYYHSKAAAGYLFTQLVNGHIIQNLSGLFLDDPVLSGCAVRIQGDIGENQNIRIGFLKSHDGTGQQAIRVVAFFS